MDANTVQSRDPLVRAIRKSCVTIAHALFLDCVASSRVGRGERVFPYTDHIGMRGFKGCFFFAVYARNRSSILAISEGMSLKMKHTVL